MTEPFEIHRLQLFYLSENNFITNLNEVVAHLWPTFLRRIHFE